MQEKINYYNIIADNIKKLRLDLNLSQERFAENIGCSREYVSRLENYKEKISLQMLFKIAELYDIEPYNLFIAKSS